MPVRVPLTEDEECAVKVTDFPAAEGLALEVNVVTVAAGLTTCANPAELLARKLESPLYLALIECEPTVRAVAEIAYVATPPERLALPSEVLPSKKETVPVGVPLYAGVTVAVRVTA